MSTTRTRRILLGITLVVAVGSAVIAPSEEMREPVAAKGRPAAIAVRQAEPRKAVEILQVARYERADEKAIVMDLFEPRIPHAQAAVAAPAPVAPALPFTYMGMVQDQAGVKVFLVQGEQLHEATAGATFAKDYRLEAISEDALKILYLPLNIEQILPIGAAK